MSVNGDGQDIINLQLTKKTVRILDDIIRFCINAEAFTTRSTTMGLQPLEYESAHKEVKREIQKRLFPDEH